MRIIHDIKITTSSIVENGEQISFTNYTALCTDGTLWSRVEGTDGTSTDWVKHPDIPIGG